MSVTGNHVTCSGLLAVNTTILAYAGIIVAAGVVVGLVLYFIATNPQSSRCAYSTQYTVHITHYTSIICHYTLSMAHSWCGSSAPSPEVQSFVGRMRVAQLAWPPVTYSLQQLCFVWYILKLCSSDDSNTSELIRGHYTHSI